MEAKNKMTIESRKTEEGNIERIIPTFLIRESVKSGKHYQEFRGEDKTLLTRCVEEDGRAEVGELVHKYQAGINSFGRSVYMLYVLQETK